MIPKVAVITAASQAIGASVVKGLRKSDHDVVANSRSIQLSDVGEEPAIPVVSGDIADPDVSY